MDDHSRRLVDDNDVIILKHHLKRDVLWADMALIGDRNRYVDNSPFFHFGFRVCCHVAINDDRALLQKPRQTGATQRSFFWHIAGQSLIKARRRGFPDLKRYASRSHGRHS